MDEVSALAASSSPLLLPTREEEIDRGKQVAEVPLKSGPGSILYSVQNDRQKTVRITDDQVPIYSIQEVLSEPPMVPNEHETGLFEEEC